MRTAKNIIFRSDSNDEKTAPDLHGLALSKMFKINVDQVGILVSSAKIVYSSIIPIFAL